MEFTETSEQQELRRVVAELSAKYGWEYTRAKSAAHEPMDELWDEAGKLGFLGVNLPAEYGGGGVGMYELAIVAEELNAGGTGLLMMVVSPAIVGTILARFGTDGQRSALAAGSGQRRVDRRLRDHRGRRRVELPPDHDNGSP